MNSNLLKLPRYGILTAALIISLVMVLFTHSQGSNNLVIHFFTSAHCPQCVEAEKFLDAMQLKYPQLTVKTYEARKDPQNAKLFTKLAQTYNVRMLATPAIFIGGFQPVIGYQSDEITGKIIESRIRYCLENGFTDPMNRISGVWPGLSETGFIRNLLAAGIEPIHPESFEQSGESSLPEEPDENILVIPFLGTVNTSEIGYLPLFTVVIAGLDSFNPCAFFVLLTLLGMLIHIRSKKRMLLVGGVFIFFSGLIYFLFMAAWLNLFMYIGELAVITIIAGVAALSMGLINIKSFFIFNEGISLSIPEDAKPGLYKRMRKLMYASSLPAVILGTVILAVVTNAYELLCTAGFPMIFTRVLTLNNLDTGSYYMYLALYNVVYVIPLFIIVLIFSISLAGKKLSEWQGRVLKLVSGLMMTSLGVVLLVNPDLPKNMFFTSGLLLGIVFITAVIIVVYRKLCVKSGNLKTEV
jgi:glutaredoxin